MINASFISFVFGMDKLQIRDYDVSIFITNLERLEAGVEKYINRFDVAMEIFENPSANGLPSEVYTEDWVARY